MKMKSVRAGEYTAPPAQGPMTRDTCRGGVGVEGRGCECGWVGLYQRCQGLNVWVLWWW